MSWALVKFVADNRLSGKLASAGSNEAGSGSSTPAAVKAAPAPARGAQNKRGGKRR